MRKFLFGYLHGRDIEVRGARNKNHNSGLEIDDSERSRNHDSNAIGDDALSTAARSTRRSPT